MLLEKYLDLAIRAHNGTSHVPEQRGEQYIKGFSEQLESDLVEVRKLNGDATAYQQKYEQLFTAWLSAKSRCLSSMITGPSGFPVRRAQKANQSEQNRYAEFDGFRTKYFERLRRNQRRKERAAIDPVAEMRENVERAERNQEAMKAANKVIVSKKLSDAEKVERLAADLGLSESKAAELLQPDYCGRVGFASYMLTNNLANIKRMRERLTVLEKKASAETKEVERPDGIRLVENREIDRLQIFFPGKPDGTTIQNLKSRGFKWSPSNGCWQRQLTDNARYVLKYILP